MKVLVAEDSATMREIVKIVLQGEVGELLFAHDAASALEQMRAQSPDLALIDQTLPDATGISLCQQLSQDPVFSGTSVLLMAGSQAGVDAQAAQAAGADGYIAKPFESQELIDQVQALAPSSAQPQDSALSAPVGTPEGNQSAVVPSHTIRGTGVMSSAPPAPPSAPSAPPPAPPARPALSDPALSDPAVVDPAMADVVTAQVGSAPQALPTGSIPSPALEVDPSPAQLPAIQGMEQELGKLGLTESQLQAVLQLSRGVVEQVVWEVVPDLAETLIREELKRLTQA